ncbi:arylsulfatase [Mariniphaga anaerophila]|uniref:Arylsulfatase n=1 Tax=Mariniphaga anaerophila TaxID=1484053 RepID=A0A1M4XGN6_9BACT|nr:sulfatase [Mariniphaga anaerophila]SHE92837.1 arylsulfatase [Mariniphaga anaerophila]
MSNLSCIQFKSAGFGLFISLLILATSCSNKSSESQSKPTNFVVIYIDDMGYGDLTQTGAIGYQTPNLDQMAAQGIFFSHYYAPQAVCSASRAGLLTGCYPNRIGFAGALSHASKTGISEKEETLAEVLKAKGYKTAIFGKWHLGVQEQFLPTRHGFDEFYGIPYSNDMWPFHPLGPGAFPDLPLFENETIVNPAVTPDDQKKFTTEFTERTVSFIKNNTQNPFFIYLAHPMPHVPLFVSDKFEGKSEQGLYGDVMMEIDWSVGQVIQTLKETGLEENTLVIFTSDNGPWINYGNHAGSTGGLREGKGTSFEGGQRVPCLMYWKETIAPGTVNNNLVSGIDILPTVAEIAAAPLPKKKIDGVSILSLIKGETNEPPRKNFWYYYRRNSLEAVQDGQWKLVFPHPGRTYLEYTPGADGQPGKVNENFPHEAGLYDLRRDPGERYNLIEEHPEIVEKLEKIAQEARNDLGDDITGFAGKNRRDPGRVKE